MKDEEYQRELEEAERLQRQINNVIDQINRTNRENAELEVDDVTNWDISVRKEEA